MFSPVTNSGIFGSFLQNKLEDTCMTDTRVIGLQFHAKWHESENDIKGKSGRPVCRIIVKGNIRNNVNLRTLARLDNMWYYGKNNPGFLRKVSKFHELPQDMSFMLAKGRFEVMGSLCVPFTMDSGVEIFDIRLRLNVLLNRDNQFCFEEVTLCFPVFKDPRYFCRTAFISHTIGQVETGDKNDEERKQVIAIAEEITTAKEHRKTRRLQKKRNKGFFNFESPDVEVLVNEGMDVVVNVKDHDDSWTLSLSPSLVKKGVFSFKTTSHSNMVEEKTEVICEYPDLNEYQKCCGVFYDGKLVIFEFTDKSDPDDWNTSYFGFNVFRDSGLDVLPGQVRGKVFRDYEYKFVDVKAALTNIRRPVLNSHHKFIKGLGVLDYKRLDEAFEVINMTMKDFYHKDELKKII